VEVTRPGETAGKALQRYVSGSAESAQCRIDAQQIDVPALHQRDPIDDCHLRHHVDDASRAARRNPLDPR
jgi:hypothetical protein